MITQPTYLPWLGYFEQIARADVFIALDTVQFSPRSWQCRNRLKGPDGIPFWLTVPVAGRPRDTSIRDIRIASDGGRWRRKHLESIRTSLGSAPHFKTIYPDVESWLLHDDERLVALNLAGIYGLCGLLGLRPEFLRASALDVSGRKTDLLVKLCRAVGANRYYSALGSKVYIEKERHLFEQAGIEVVYQTWAHPRYAQRGKGFVSHLSAIDALMNVGAEDARRLISHAE